MKKGRQNRNGDESEQTLDHEFLSCYFDLLRYLFEGCESEVTEAFIEGSILPRLLAIKMIVRQFEHANPAMSREMDRIVDELGALFQKDPDINDFFRRMKTEEETEDEESEGMERFFRRRNMMS